MFLLKSSIGFLAYLSSSQTLVSAQSPYQPPLPIVDLGYELHQAIAFNDAGNYYNFSNIRYAAAPIGNRRFRVPKPPAVNRISVQNGAESRICPQANPSWISNVAWVTQYLTGQPITLNQSTVSHVNESLTESNVATLAPQAADASEDCLFLDVMVPKTIFDRGLKNASGSAVMVWIHGGGYTAGSKAQFGNPAGLLQRSRTQGKRGVIYVAINYRLGAFGWLAGSTVQADGEANAGLYDQRMALDWVQKYIHLFGGDPDRVTIFGESAGGGSVMHQITAYGGARGAVPFHQAIPQSPGYLPQTSKEVLEAQYETFLSYANVTSIDDLRALPSSTLIAANTLHVWHSPFGTFTYQPSVDGCFVPALPASLLACGDYDKNVRIMAGHNQDEGLIFANPLVQTEDDFSVFLRILMPVASDAVLNYVAETLYPPVYNGSYGYTNPIARSALLISEWIFTCNTNWLARAKNGHAYSYYFTVFPALHGFDVAYTFYNNGPATSAVPNTTLAVILQDWLVTYAQGGTPKTPDAPATPKFPMYGADDVVMELGAAAVEPVPDVTANERCRWWQEGLYV